MQSKWAQMKVYLSPVGLALTISLSHTYTNTLSEYNDWFSCTRMGSQLSECDTCNESFLQEHMPLVIFLPM